MSQKIINAYNAVIQVIRNQQGSALVIVSFALVSLLAMSGLVLDGGSLYFTKSHLQKTANAAALSGAQELTRSADHVNHVVTHILAAHNEEDSLHNTEVTMFNQLKVSLSKEVPLAFSRLFGRQLANVDAEATAQIASMGRAYGAAPLGIDDSIQLQYNTTYKLRVDQTGVESGVFGVLALGGTGANRYEDNLLYGYIEEIGVGDILDTQTGNISGKTRTSIKARIDACPYPVGEIHHKDCPRVLLVPVYKPHDHTQNQMKSVKITGFAYFYITEPMSSQDTSITGMFIRRSGQGVIVPGAVDRGAYSIRLIK